MQRQIQRGARRDSNPLRRGIAGNDWRLRTRQSLGLMPLDAPEKSPGYSLGAFARSMSERSQSKP